jgi:hypothetical protein
MALVELRVLHMLADAPATRRRRWPAAACPRTGWQVLLQAGAALGC